jgi:hypothetical protein
MGSLFRIHFSESGSAFSHRDAHAAKNDVADSAYSFFAVRGNHLKNPFFDPPDSPYPEIPGGKGEVRILPPFFPITILFAVVLQYADQGCHISKFPGLEERGLG